MLRASREFVPDAETARAALADAFVAASAELRRHGPDAAEQSVLAQLSVAEVAIAISATDKWEEPALDPDPYDDYVAPRLRARRRRRLRTALVAACVVAVLGVAYAVGGTSAPRDQRASGDVLSWPVRGPLAHDQAFVGALARRAAHGRVIYAGDVARARVALALTPALPGARLTLVAFVAPRGTPADRMEVSYAGAIAPTSRLVSWADPESSGVHVLVVLAESRARTAAVSTMPVPRLGYIDRSFVTRRMHNGVLAIPVHAPSVRMMRVSVEGTPGSPSGGPVLGIERVPYYPGSLLPVPQRSFGAVTGIDEAWREAATELAATYRVPFTRLRVSWRWARHWGRRTVLLAAAYRLPTGAVVLQVRWRSWQIDNSVAVNRFVEGRPLLDPTEPVAWQMGDQVAVFYPGRPHHPVVVNGSLRSSPEQVLARTDAGGFVSVTVPQGMRDPSVEVPLRSGRPYGLILSTTSPFDLDPLDVGAGAVQPDSP